MLCPLVTISWEIYVKIVKKRNYWVNTYLCK